MKGWINVPGTKTENAARAVDLPLALREELTELKARRATAGRDDLLFGTSTGGKDSQSSVRRRTLAPAVERANARLEEAGEDLISEELTPHGLRHSFATFAAAYLGWEAGYLAEQMGHSDPSFTYSRYCKWVKRRPGEAERIRALFAVDAVTAEGAAAQDAAAA